jgi:hypothetical protein
MAISRSFKGGEKRAKKECELSWFPFIAISVVVLGYWSAWTYLGW